MASVTIVAVNQQEVPGTSLQLIFSTKDRERTLPDEIRPDLHAYMGGTLQGLGCLPIEINTEPDPLHVLFLLARTEALSEVDPGHRPSASALGYALPARWAGFVRRSVSRQGTIWARSSGRASPQTAQRCPASIKISRFISRGASSYGQSVLVTFLHGLVRLFTGPRMIDPETRQYAAILGRRYFEGTVTFEALMEQLEDSEDPLILALVQAIQHEPARGFLGISQERWERTFRRPVQEILDELEKGEAGVVPEERVYPKVTLWGIFGWSLLSLWAAASAAEAGMRLWNALAEAESFPFWAAAWHSFALVIMTVSSAIILRGVVQRWRLYRSRRAPRP